MGNSNFPVVRYDPTISNSSLYGRSSEEPAESERLIKEPLSPVELDEKTTDSSGDDDWGADPRLESYPIPVVAKTVDIHNDDTEPILTFRFWVLSTFWIVAGCTISSVYYFKPYSVNLSPYVVQLCSWGMGTAMDKYLPKSRITMFGLTWTLNPGHWNAKEHALILVAFWGSASTASGLGPLSAMELYYNKRMSAAWSIMFLMTTQLMGYGFAGLYRDVLVRPPQLYYPGVLPTVALFNALHKSPSMTAKSFRFFSVVVAAAFCYQWFPSLIWPMLSSLPLLCHIGRGDWRAFVLGSGTYGFGLLDFSLDWNYISFFSPLYTPLWANANRFLGAIVACWLLYPIAYFFNTLGAMNLAPMSPGTWDATGDRYNVSAILTPQYELNQTSLAAYSAPRWSFSYSMHFFWGFASTGAILAYALLFHSRSTWASLRGAPEDHEYNDPYLKLTAHLPRVPHWWYISLLLACLVVSVIQLYGGEMQLPWWGLMLITAVSSIFVYPSGILFGFANIQIGMDYIAELIAGALFPGKPIAVLTGTVYGRQVLEQCLNLVSDLKLGFYMKIPERELFLAQVYGTAMGPIINWGCMRFIIDTQGPQLTGEVPSMTWNALKTKNFYSASVIWGVLGPRTIFGQDSTRWLLYGFLVGPLAVVLMWLMHRAKPNWSIDKIFNPVIMFHGAALFPIFTTTNLTTSMITALTFMGYVYRYHPAWFGKYSYLLGAGLDCGTQLVQMLMIVAASMANVTMPHWWGNDAKAVDRCFPPKDLPPNVLN